MRAGWSPSLCPPVTAHSDGPYRCDLCWSTFDTPAELAEHEEGELWTLYPIEVETELT